MVSCTWPPYYNRARGQSPEEITFAHYRTKPSHGGAGKDHHERSAQSISEEAATVRLHQTELTTDAVVVAHDLPCGHWPSWAQRLRDAPTHTETSTAHHVREAQEQESNYTDIKLRPLRFKLSIENYLLLHFKCLYYYYKGFFQCVSEEYVNSKFRSEQQSLNYQYIYSVFGHCWVIRMLLFLLNSILFVVLTTSILINKQMVLFRSYDN